MIFNCGWHKLKITKTPKPQNPVSLKSNPFNFFLSRTVVRCRSFYNCFHGLSLSHGYHFIVRVSGWLNLGDSLSAVDTKVGVSLVLSRSWHFLGSSQGRLPHLVDIMLSLFTSNVDFIRVKLLDLFHREHLIETLRILAKLGSLDPDGIRKYLIATSFGNSANAVSIIIWAWTRFISNLLVDFHESLSATCLESLSATILELGVCIIPFWIDALESLTRLRILARFWDSAFQFDSHVHFLRVFFSNINKAFDVVHSRICPAFLVRRVFIENLLVDFMMSSKLETFIIRLVHIKGAFNIVCTGIWPIFEFLADSMSRGLRSYAETWCFLMINQAHWHRWG